MEAPSKRMRLTVVVEALAEENAHGDYRDVALAAFKERKFAMPVQLDVTFEAVWADIEQRYKTNYLDPQQAATFSIKKLQDAYDCDLDMTDTVGDIFAGEADVKMRVIKVIPHFIYRQAPRSVVERTWRTVQTRGAALCRSSSRAHTKCANPRQIDRSPRPSHSTPWRRAQKIHRSCPARPGR
jgi:hypothetical protein